jgi:signal transduction histidine kinase
VTRAIRWGRPTPWLVALGAITFGIQLLASLVYGDPPQNNNGAFFVIIIGLALSIWGAIGWLIAAQRPTNPISIVMGGEAFLVGVAGLASYVTSRWPDARVSPPLNDAQGYLVPMLLAVPLLLLLFPTGSPPSRRWNAVLWLMGVSTVAGLIGLGLAPADNIEWSPLASNLTRLSAAAGLLATAMSIAAVVVRFRRSRGDERAQMRWLVLVALVGATFLALLLVSSVFDPTGNNPFSEAMWAFLLLTIALALPSAIGVAVLRYRLYDIEVVIKKTLVALVLALIIGVIGVGAFAIAGQVALYRDTPRAVAVVIGLVLGIMLVPLLRLSRRVADRLVYGKRATPYEVLASFSSRVGEAYSSDDVLPRMAQILRAGTGAASAHVLVRIGTELKEAATVGERGGAEHVEPIVFQGEDVGALAVTFPANDPLDQPRGQLVANLAAQAGPVVRNVRLIEELRASRQRLVTAQDEERRKIERNLHDGVQQQLVALNVQLGLLARVVESDPERAGEMATSLQGRATEALDDLRDLARGIYPPLLADKGLTAALEAQARKAAVPTTIESDGIGRYDRAVESAVYFCALEALNNTAKYAGTAGARVSLAEHDGHLHFEIADDGAGFDAQSRSYGTGLQGMADRLDAIGGELHVTSEPGEGATVSGEIPIGGPG